MKKKATATFGEFSKSDTRVSFRETYDLQQKLMYRDKVQKWR